MIFNHHSSKVKSSNRVALWLALGLMPLSACQATTSQIEAKGGEYFDAVTKEFPREEKNLRQWDTPVVADLDQDGYPDLLLNDHGFAVRVMWNNKGRFSKPYDLIMGDMHGITVGDIEQDGQLEIVISRGGGSGSNARNTKIFTVTKSRQFKSVPDYEPPLALMRGRTVKLVDMDNDGDLDLMNFAFPSKKMNFSLPAEEQGKSETYLYKNQDGQLLEKATLPPVPMDGQKTLLTDFNNDNIVDFLWHGHGEVKVFVGQPGIGYKQDQSLLPATYQHVTGIAEIDFDNDGDFDLFFTRGKAFVKGETFHNSEQKLLGYYSKRGKFDFNNLAVGDVLKLENIQSQWPNKNLYIGESGYDYQFPGETHSGRDVRLVNSDALGFPDKMTKKGTYIGYVGNKSWRIAGNIFSPNTAVIHGIESYPESKHAPGLTNVLLENRDGKFVDVSAKYGFNQKDHFNALAVADIDNNGFSDLILLRRGELVFDNVAQIFLNFEGKFKPLAGHRVVTTEVGAIGMGIQQLDYNLDGRMDLIIGNERGKWHLFNNQMDSAQTNRYLKVKVEGSPLGKATGLGALVKLEACGNSQSQRIGNTGAQYSLSFDPYAHFGLGQCQEPASVTVTWSNGEQLIEKISRKKSVTAIGKSI